MPIFQSRETATTTEREEDEEFCRHRTNNLSIIFMARMYSWISDAKVTVED